MESVEPASEPLLPIEAGAYAAANHDLNEALKDDPEFIEKRFIAILKSSPELGRFLLNSTYDARSQ